jgi:phytoene synthase
MRLGWWLEAIDEVFAGRPPRTHPALSAFADVLRDAQCTQATLHALVDARAKDLDVAPFSSWDELDAYLDATAGGVVRLGLELCGASAPEELVRHAAKAWGCMGLARAEPYWRSRGRSALPPGAATDDMLARARTAYTLTKTLRVAPAAAPALAYVSLTPIYVRALERGGDAPLLARQLTLIRAILTGRL